MNGAGRHSPQSTHYLSNLARVRVIILDVQSHKLIGSFNLQVTHQTGDLKLCQEHRTLDPVEKWSWHGLLLAVVEANTVASPHVLGAKEERDWVTEFLRDSGQKFGCGNSRPALNL